MTIMASPATNPLAPSAVPAADHPASVHGFFKEALSEAQDFLKQQPNYERIEDCMRQILNNKDEALRPKKLSLTSKNQLGKAAKVLAAYYTDIKPFWDFQSTNHEFEKHALIFNGLSETWYQKRNIDRQIEGVVKFALPAGSSVAHTTWSPDILDIVTTPRDIRDVLPVRPNSMVSYQDAFATIIRYETTVNYLEGRYPHLKGAIKPTRDGSQKRSEQQSRFERVMATLNRSPAYVAQAALNDPELKVLKGKIPRVHVYEAYIHDPAINNTNSPVPMGPWRGRNPLTNYAYLVQPGDPLYPRMRHVITTPDLVLEDGPNKYWHGMVPVAKLMLDMWPWTWLGKSPLHDCMPLQESLNRSLRAMDDHREKVLRPPVKGVGVGRNELKAIDSRQPGQTYRSNPGREISVEEVPNLDPVVEFLVGFAQDSIDELSGARDTSRMMSLNQMPAQETIEKMLESMSPDVRAQSRSVEVFMREFAQMIAFNFMQYYDASRRFWILGPPGVTMDDYDLFDPGTFIPRALPGQKPDPGAIQPEYDRADAMMHHFSYKIAPGSLLRSSEAMEKVLYTRLFGMGAMDIWTLFEKLGVPNMGTPPSGTIPERIQEMRKMGIGQDPNATPGPKPSGDKPPSLQSDGAISNSG